jgi:signal transduction histidine kinase/tetratricopeptide (TPR) repeat protein
MKKIVLCLFFLFSVSLIFGQANSKVDSLKRVLAKLPVKGKSFSSDTLRVRLLCNMGSELIDLMEADEYLREANEIVNMIDWPEGEVLTKYLVARRTKKKFLLFKAERDFFEVLRLAEKYDLNNIKGLALRNIGDIYNINFDPKTSLEYYAKAVQLFSKLGIPDEEILTLNNIGIAHLRLKNYLEAKKYFENCLKQSKSHKLSKYEGIAYANLANLSEENQQYKEALKFYIKALDLYDSQKNKMQNEYNLAYGGIANVNLKLGNFERAEFYANKSLNYSKNPSFPAYLKSTEVIIACLIRKNEFKKAYFLSHEIRSKIENQNKIEAERKLANAKLEFDLFKSQEDLNQEERNKKNAYIALLIAIFCSIFLFYFYFVLRKKNKTIYNQNNRIIDLNNDLERKIETRTAELSIANKELVLKNFEITEALFKGQTLERKRVAAELHDNLGSTLSALKWRLEALDSDNLNEKEKEIYLSIKSMMSNAYDDVRNISHNLLPAEFETKGLTGALEKYICDLNENGKIKFTFKTEGDLAQMDKKVALELYSISLELITNILKHSGATKATISILKSKTSLILLVEDNGHKNKITNPNGSALGLQNLRNRAELINSKLDYYFTQEGFKVKISLTS